MGKEECILMCDEGLSGREVVTRTGRLAVTGLAGLLVVSSCGCLSRLNISANGEEGLLAARRAGTELRIPM
eukprot:scaffold15407_cov58-Attheya_sp.AAC.3